MKREKDPEIRLKNWRGSPRRPASTSVGSAPPPLSTFSAAPAKFNRIDIATHSAQKTLYPPTQRDEKKHGWRSQENRAKRGQDAHFLRGQVYRRTTDESYPWATPQRDRQIDKRTERIVSTTHMSRSRMQGIPARRSAVYEYGGWWIRQRSVEGTFFISSDGIHMLTPKYVVWYRSTVFLETRQSRRLVWRLVSSRRSLHPPRYVSSRIVKQRF